MLAESIAGVSGSRWRREGEGSNHYLAIEQTISYRTCNKQILRTASAEQLNVLDLEVSD